MDSLKNPTFRKGGFTKNQYKEGLPKKGGPGQFVDLIGGFVRNRGMVFLRMCG